MNIQASEGMKGGRKEGRKEGRSNSINQPLKQ